MTVRAPRARSISGAPGSRGAATPSGEDAPLSDVTANVTGRSTSAATLVGAALLVGASGACTPPPFPVVSAPSIPALSANVPAPPKLQPSPTSKVAWKVVDRSNKVPLRKRSVGLRMSSGRASSLESDTAQLMVAMMGKGFASLVDLSGAQAVDAEITRTTAGNTVILRGKLDAMIRVNNPLRTDFTLLVSVVGLGGADIRSLELDAKDLEAYARSYDAYRRSVEKYLATNEEVTRTYRDEFAKARREYQAKPKPLFSMTGNTSFSEVTATSEYEAQVKQLLQVHEDAKQALARVPTPEQVKATGGAVTASSVGVRLVGTAEVIESSTNRVVWVGLLDLSDVDEETARARVVEALVAALPPT